MADDKTTEGGDGLKKILVIIIIWGGLMILLFSNSSSRGFLTKIFPFLKTAQKTEISQTSIFIYNGNNVAPTNFYGGEKTSIFDVAQSRNNPSIFYAATDSGIFVSTDNAQNWHRITLPEELADKTISRIFINYSRPYDEISLLVFERKNVILYITRDNFFSVEKSFEISQPTIEGFAKDKSATIIKPMFNGNIMIGTAK